MKFGSKVSLFTNNWFHCLPAVSSSYIPFVLRDNSLHRLHTHKSLSLLRHFSDSVCCVDSGHANSSPSLICKNFIGLHRVLTSNPSNTFCHGFMGLVVVYPHVSRHLFLFFSRPVILGSDFFLAFRETIMEQHAHRIVGTSGTPRIHLDSWTLKQSFCGIRWRRILQIEPFEDPSRSTCVFTSVCSPFSLPVHRVT